MFLMFQNGIKMTISGIVQQFTKFIKPKRFAQKRHFKEQIERVYRNQANEGERVAKERRTKKGKFMRFAQKGNLNFRMTCKCLV